MTIGSTNGCIHTESSSNTASQTPPQSHLLSTLQFNHPHHKGEVQKNARNIKLLPCVVSLKTTEAPACDAIISYLSLIPVFSTMVFPPRTPTLDLIIS